MNSKQILREIGQRILTRRKQLHMTQEHLAEKMEVSTQMISYVETGQKAIRPENLIKLCGALNVSADYILMGEISTLDCGLLAQKLAKLSPDEFRCVETILDGCFQLIGQN